jgi:hypothetical protein
MASDGVNTTTDVSDGVFSVAPKSPQVYLASPHQGAAFAPGRWVELSGLASDAEDGPLGGDALAWSATWPRTVLNLAGISSPSPPPTPMACPAALASASLSVTAAISP